MENLTRPTNPEGAGFTKGLLTKRPVVSVSFAAVLVLFFFNFVDFRCNGVRVESFSGYNLVFGKHLKNVADGYRQSTDIFDQLTTDKAFSTGTGSEFQEDGAKPNIWAIMSLAAAIMGWIVFFKGGIKQENGLGLALGIFGFLSLIITAVAIENKIKLQAGNMALIEIRFKAGYWLSLVAFAVAGAASCIRIKHEVKDEKKTGTPVFSKLNVFISSAPPSFKKDY
jgi:hypothetical protein